MLAAQKAALKADINVTPLVDVMLVLLIIMMLIAPMLQQGVAVTLPEAGNTVDEARHAGPDGRRRSTRPTSSGSTASRSRRTSSPTRVKTALEDKTEKVVLIKGDKDAQVQRDHGGDGRAPQGRDRGHRPDHREEEATRRAGGRQVVMAHAHKHFGAEKVVRGETPHASADMNVTPLIDVLLVLLIIFMAALPLTQKGVDINLPLETKAPTQPQRQHADRARVHGRPVDRRQPPAGHAAASSRPRLRDIFETRKEKTMFIVGDGDAALRRHRRGHRRRQGRRRREGRHRHRRACGSGGSATKRRQLDARRHRYAISRQGRTLAGSPFSCTAQRRQAPACARSPDGVSRGLALRS